MAGKLTSIDLADHKTIRGANKGGNLFWFDPKAKSWCKLPGAGTCITGDKKSTWVINKGGDIFSHSWQKGSIGSAVKWSKFAGALDHVSANKGHVWGINGLVQFFSIFFLVSIIIGSTCSEFAN